ncbi:hypothetical protein GCM10028807_59650 [Spirosoma daeguense]
MKTILFTLLIASLLSSRPDLDAVPPVPVPCKMSNGQPRLFPCEFQIQTLYFLGKNQEVVGKITPTNTTVSLPKSKAVKTIHSTGSDSYTYNVSLDFKRINTPSFSPKPNTAGLPPLKTGFYEIGRSTVSSPITPSEVTLIKKVDVSPDMPSANSRPNRVSFTLQLNYATGNGAALIAPVQYIQIKNPITFTKFPASINLYRDRSEAWIAFSLGVDLAK